MIEKMKALSSGILAAGCMLVVACGGGGGGDGGGNDPLPVTFDLSVTKSGSGTGTISSSPAGIQCGATCTKSYVAGAKVTLSAAALDGSTFGGWSGACTGTGTCAVTMTEATAVTAAFISFHDRPAVSSRRVHYAAGTDGKFGTTDDVVTAYNQVTFQPGGDSAHEEWYAGSNPKGPDGQWFTSDDVPGGYWKQPGGTYGWNTRTAGDDGKWFTPDDPVTDWEKFGPTSNGVAINPVYNGAGPDRTWFTDDDVVSSYYQRTIDSTGAEVRRVTFIGSGADGKWFTADDVMDSTGYWTATYSHGNTRWASWDRQVNYTSPGGDGKWLTADDVIGTCVTHEFADDSQYWTTENTYTPGPDGMCFTGDDRLVGQGRATNTY